jgi:hypothetical protein
MLLILVMVVIWINVWPLPDTVPIKWNPDGSPRDWAPGWSLPVAWLFANLLMLVLGIAWDGLWSQHESRKWFNPFCLVDELVLVLLLRRVAAAATAASHPPFMLRPAPTWTWALGVFAVAVAIVLEILRPVVPELLEAEDETSELGSDAMAWTAAGRPWVYWSIQNPAASRWLLPVLGAGMLVNGILNHGRGVQGVIAVLAGAIALVMTGGFRTSVTPGRLTLRLGHLGIPLLRIPTREIVRTEIRTSAAFLGIGIRRARGITAFFLDGQWGVLLRTIAGKQYLIGTRRPEELASVLNAAHAQATQGSLASK